MHNLAKRTRLVMNLAGPAVECNSTDLMGACASTGTDYIDITGEVEWASRMRQKWGAAAAASGARLVNFGGFSSVISDLAVHTAVQEYRHVVGQYAPLSKATCLYSLHGGPMVSQGALQTLVQTPVFQFWNNVVNDVLGTSEYLCSWIYPICFDWRYPNTKLTFCCILLLY